MGLIDDASGSGSAGLTPALVAAAITLGVGLVIAAGTQIVTHVLQMRQWRYERRFTVFSQYLSAITELLHRTSGLLDDAEESAVHDWTELARELQEAQERVTTAYNQIQLVARQDTVRVAESLFVAVMELFNMASGPVDNARKLNASESDTYRARMTETYRPAKQAFMLSARSDISER